MNKMIQKVLASLGRASLEQVLQEATGVSYLTYNYKGGYPAGSVSGLSHRPGAFTVSAIKFDMAKIAAARVAAGQAAIGAADVLEVFTVPANTWVLGCAVLVSTVEGAAATMDVGDGDSAAGYISNADLNALGLTASQATSAYSLAVGGGKVYAAADTIDLVIDAAGVDAAVFTVLVASISLQSDRS